MHFTRNHIMSTYMGDARTVVLASLPFNLVSKIVGNPSNSEVSKWFRQMCSNLILLTAPLEVGRGKGHLDTSELYGSPTILLTGLKGKLARTAILAPPL